MQSSGWMRIADDGDARGYAKVQPNEPKSLCSFRIMHPTRPCDISAQSLSLLLLSSSLLSSASADFASGSAASFAKLADLGS